MIELNTINDIALLAESSVLECKLAGGRDGKGALPNDFWESYSALANTDGGVILLGVKEKKGVFELRGIEHIDKIRKDLFAIANNPKKVSVNLLTNDSVQVIPIEGTELIRVDIPRASREKRPVYLNGNPLGNSFVRRYEGDQRLSDEAVKRMLAEQAEDSRDSRILKGFGLEDLSSESVRVYRQVFANRQPDHPWNELENRAFLQKIGSWRKDRETGEDGLTVAGLLMFGLHTTIQEVFPYYMLDYQERPEAKTEKRWVDRLTLDGTWSGNLYDFYRLVFRKLTVGLKVPFQLDGDQRVDESPVHIAIREALCNVLVHADYSDRASVLVVKRPDLFGFRNPGMMRIPLEYAMQGGHADCRNRGLHQMFRYVGIGDQAGSGVPKIIASWHECHWRLPELMDTPEPFDQTILRMRMVDLFPQEQVEQLRLQFGSSFDLLSHTEQVALVIAAIENTVTNQRLCSLQNIHPADASRCLHGLVARGILEQTGSNRGAVYHITGMSIPGPEDVFDSSNLKLSSPHLESSSGDLGSSSGDLELSFGHLESNSGNLAMSSPDLNRDIHGRLISDHHNLPFVEDLQQLTMAYTEALAQIAEEPRKKKKVSRSVMREVLLKLLEAQFVTLGCLANLVNRDPDSLRKQYLSEMVKKGEVEIAFPRTPNDPRQAYTKAK
ncbi:RNA-binding domain-containing protein [Desulfogranum marinum]|uniref:RNA-binding domain-containing protein n=1 Tax=Desulfogranum marinum TaxID=453220 RepID=UPI0029C8BE7A|nr:RNA-binding domain-containing protein [Desulfogranum marinum]